MQIALSQNRFATVSPEDHAPLSRSSWHAVKCGNKWYARRAIKSGGKTTAIYMHREILGASTAEARFVDHIDGNGLNNKRENLRLATRAENNANIHRISGASGFRCVFKQGNSFVVRIGQGNENRYFGCYETALEAAFWANHYLNELHLQFGVRNSIDYPALLEMMAARKATLDSQIATILKASHDH